MFSLKNQDGIIDATILELDPFKDSSDIITDVATKKEKVKSAALTSGMASYNTFKKQTLASIKNAVTTTPTKKNGTDNVTVTERDNAVNLITDEKFTDAIFSKFEKAIKFDATGNYTGETNLFELGEDTSTKDIKPLMKDVLFEFGVLIKNENENENTKGKYKDLINIVDFTDLKDEYGKFKDPSEHTSIKYLDDIAENCSEFVGGWVDKVDIDITEEWSLTLNNALTKNLASEILFIKKMIVLRQLVD